MAALEEKLAEVKALYKEKFGEDLDDELGGGLLRSWRWASSGACTP